MHRLPCLLKIGCHEDPSKDVLFCAQNIWICGLRLWSISLNGEAQFCCLYPRPDGRGKDCRSTNKSTDSAPSSPQQITTLIYLLLKYTTYTFVLMDPKNVTFCFHELKLSCPDQGLTSWLPDWTNKLIAGVELSCTQTPGHRLSLRTSRCFFFPVWEPNLQKHEDSLTNMQRTVFMSPPAVTDSAAGVRSCIGGCDITRVISRLSPRLLRDERLRGVFDVTEGQRALACNLPSRRGVCFHHPPPHLDAQCFQLRVTTAAFTHLRPAVSRWTGGGAFDVRCLVGGGGSTLTTFMCFPIEKWKEKVALSCSSNLD